MNTIGPPQNVTCDKRISKLKDSALRQECKELYCRAEEMFPAVKESMACFVLICTENNYVVMPVLLAKETIFLMSLC